MIDDKSFQSIDDDNNVFEKIEDVINDNDNQVDAFVSGLPDWDLEPLYETFKRGDNR